jgi:TonB-linked SusC/RagA family outer membrane protein
MRGHSWSPTHRLGALRLLRSLATCVATALLLSATLHGPVRAQAGAVSGRVVDTRNLAPLAGAQIAVEGSGKGTLSDSRGHFTLQGLSGAQVTLQVVMLGYQTLRRTVAVGQSDVVLALEQSAIELNQLVVTGTAGATQRRAIGNSIAQIQAGTIAQTAPVTDLGQLLNARAPGVIVLPPSGSVGSGPRILIRGKSSFSLSSDPLIYVDGVRVDNRGPTGGSGFGDVSRLNDIDPDEIQSIEIIKGPAAATLYGTEATNGVIQIITKRGRPGQTRIDASVREGVNWFMNPEGRWPINYYKDPTSGEVVAFNLARTESQAGRPLFQNGQIQGYSVSASGGTDQVQYYAGFDYDHDAGAIPTSLSQTTGGRVNITATPSKALDIRGSAGFTVVRTNTGNDGNYMFNSVLSRPGNRDTPTRGFYGAPAEVLVKAQIFTIDENHFTTSTELDHHPATWFAERLKAGLDLSNEVDDNFMPRLTPDLAQFYTPTQAAGSKSIAQTNLLNTTLDYSGTLTFPLGHGLSSATSVGAQYYRQMTRLLSATGRGFPAPGVETLAGAAVTFGSDDYVENVTVGLYAQEQLSLNDRLFVTAALRGDDNSAFGKHFKAVYYPKFSASWVLNEEPWWHVGFIDALKLRMAYGQSGQQPQAFAALRTFEPVTGQAGASAVTPQFVGNPDLGPERASELEVGFEAGLLRQRLGLDFTFYNRTTHNAIVLRDVAPSTGFPGQQYVNLGGVRNRGVELLVTGHVLQAPNAALDLTFNVSHNSNSVLAIGLPNTPYLESGFGNRIEPGYPIWGAWARRVVSADRGPDGTPINIKCDDGKGGAVDCASAPHVYVGPIDPPTQGSVSAAFTFRKSLTLSALVDFKHGAREWSSSLWCPGILGCKDEVYPGDFNPVFAASSVLGYTDDARWWMDVSFTKLREVSLSYVIPARLSRIVGAQRASIVFAARNLHTWTRFPGLDPENVSRFADTAFATQFEQNEVPQLAQFITKLNVSF